MKNSDEKRQILAFGNYHDAIYHPFTGVDEKLREILPDEALVCTDDVSLLADLKKDQYSCVISYLDRWKSSLPRENFPELKKEEAEGLIRYVADGGFLLILHNGISIQSREELKDLAGARFLGHPAMEPITFVPEGFLKECGCKSFTIAEEPYQLELTDHDGKQFILFYEYRGKQYPAGWQKSVGAGHVVYLCPGHTTEQFSCPEYQQIICEAVKKYCTPDLPSTD